MSTARGASHAIDRDIHKNLRAKLCISIWQGHTDGYVPEPPFTNMV